MPPHKLNSKMLANAEAVKLGFFCSLFGLALQGGIKIKSQ